MNEKIYLWVLIALRYILNLKVVQAEFGDCMILEYGASKIGKRNYILIDGGPASSYGKNLKKELLKIRDNHGKLDLIIVSHIDNDHINGLIKLMAEIRGQKAKNSEQIIDVKAFWYNAFSRTIGKDNDIEDRLSRIMKRSRGKRVNMTPDITERVTKGVKEGNELSMYADQLRIPINQDFNSDIITVGGIKDTIAYNKLRIYIVGPSEKSLDDLRKQWLEWLEKHEKAVDEKNRRIAALLDRSVPNLSSIMFLVEENGKRILFTGDGLGDHLLEGLKQKNLLDSEGMIKVDILKLPHHGSERNISKQFFRSVIADKYVISANGRDDNPSLSTLTYIAESAKEDHRSVEIILTNNSSSVDRFVTKYPKSKYGYEIKILEPNLSSIDVNLG
jgi:ribonuclease BN (tRNA processing enzyme)